MANENTYWRSPELGRRREIDVGGGTMRVFERGSGPTIAFVHGALVNANLWRKVVPLLADDFRCVCVDMPLGSHELPMPAADLSPSGLAGLVADAFEALDLENVTLVGNDTGGGLCQIVVAERPERIGRLMLTSCDAFENFPPRFFKVVLAPAAFPALVPLLFAPMRLRAARETPIAFGWLMHSKLDPVAGDSYTLPALSNPGVRKDFARALKGLRPQALFEAAAHFARFDRPVTIAWSRDDRFFPLEHAERLARAFPNARLEWIEDSRTFSAEDRPDRVAELARALAARETGATPAAAGG